MALINPKWNVAACFVIASTIPYGQVLAVQSQVVRVLVKESNRLRFRADGDQPLLVRGLGSSKRKLSSLKVKKINGALKFAVNGDLSRWSRLPGNVVLRITSKDSRGIWLGKRRYRGELRVNFQDGKPSVVNHLDLEKYLMSVVGSEMPKSWPRHALMAQAVAARTYAMQQMGKVGIYDIKATEASQVYLGVESETNSTRLAVNKTRSLVLVHRGRLINAVFHSSSGGKTERSGAVWKRQLPYLISVRDYDQESPYYRWEKQFSPRQLEVVFSEIGGLNSVQVLSKSRTGRVLEVRLYGPSGNLDLTGKELRRRLELKSTLVKFRISAWEAKSNKFNQLFGSFGGSSTSREKVSSLTIPSSKIFTRDWSLKDEGELVQPDTPPLLPPLFPPLPSLVEMQPPPSLPPLPKNFYLVVVGSGAGHGVGMSQWGALALAKRGDSFRRILTHYYKGVDIIPFSAT